MKILILGGTGFLGKYLVRELAGFADQLYVVTRNIQNSAFNEYKNVHLIAGDITDLEVIKDPALKKMILSECDVIIHAAALYDLTAQYEDIYLHNVVGTQNVLQMLKLALKLKSFYYVSTIAVADEQTAVLDEVSLPERSNFHDNYSKTKYFAEKMVRDFSLNSKIPTRIIRPAAIIGDSVTGDIDNINGPYYFLNFIKKFQHLIKNIPILPITYNKKSHLFFIPVDHVAQFMSLLLKRDSYSQELKTYHLICIDPPTTEDFLKDICQELKLETKFVPLKANKFFERCIFPAIKIPKEIIPFMFSKISYDKSLTLKDLPELKNSKYADFKKIFFLK
jgi:nucleoside-diphosphate-sugar epimerase